VADIMSLGALFRRAFRRLSGVGTERPEHVLRSADGPSALERERAAAWLAAFEAGRLNPPQDIHDPMAWDQYWRNQIDVGAMDQGFADMMSSDPGLPGLLATRGARTILSGLAASSCGLRLTMTSAMPSNGSRL
jgi:hypothetical protein